MENTLSFYYILGYISAISIIVPFLFGIISFKHLNKNDKLILILFGLGCVTELVGRIYATIISPNNTWIFNIYQILETLLITIFYLRFYGSNFLKIMLALFLGVFLIVSIFQIQKIDTKSLNGVSLSIESIAIIIFAIVAFHLILKAQDYSNILGAPLFWFNSGFLIYFSGMIFLHLFSKYLLEHALYTFFELWGFWHSIISIVFYTLVSIGFWKTRTLQT